MNRALSLIVGTTMGNAEAVADEIEPLLIQRGFQVTNTLSPISAQLLTSPLWLIVCSTHGAGEVPENLQPWLQWLATQTDLSDHQYALCGIGDSSYDTFCGALILIESELQRVGMIPFVDKIEIDVQAIELPENKALMWIQNWPMGS
ncbi:MAG: flavodoxin domain-containing protein [Ferrimonas sp.]